MTVVDESYFQQPDLPTDPFMIEDQNGDVDGPFKPDEFVPDEYGVMMHQGDAAHPLFLRVVNQTGNMITCLDGDGETWEYKLIPIVTRSPSSAA